MYLAALKIDEDRLSSRAAFRPPCPEPLPRFSGPMNGNSPLPSIPTTPERINAHVFELNLSSTAPTQSIASYERSDDDFASAPGSP